MTTKRTRAATVRATSSIAMWVFRAAALCAGLLAMFALVVVLATLMPAMIVATATPALAASTANQPRKRFALRHHLLQTLETNCGGGAFQTVNRRGESSRDARVRRQRR